MSSATAGTRATRADTASPALMAASASALLAATALSSSCSRPGCLAWRERTSRASLRSLSSTSTILR
eukprot:scaffold234715_cov39-Prasinocladus_malaysianus.AAC.1